MSIEYNLRHAEDRWKSTRLLEIALYWVVPGSNRVWGYKLTRPDVIPCAIGIIQAVEFKLVSPIVHYWYTIPLR
eukprot:389763-Amorphochlora_amoeboformis.AAC.1